MEQGSFFTNGDLARFRSEADDAWIKMMEHLKAGGILVLPFDGLGSGLAQLKVRAPRIWQEIQREVNELCRYANGLA